MRGCIRFSDGNVLWFTDDNYQDVIASLTDDQRAQLANLLRDRLGPRNPLPVDVDQEAYESWYEDTHRKDVMLGGGSGAESAKVNRKGGKKYSIKDWNNKGDSDRNIVWLRNMGFRKKWDYNRGYVYTLDGYIEADLILVSKLSHDDFKQYMRQRYGLWD